MCTDPYRTHHFTILATSFLLDVPQPTDFLYSALYTLTDYGQAREDSDRPKMVAQRPAYPC
jgi:hypothetical protein